MTTPERVTLTSPDGRTTYTTDDPAEVVTLTNAGYTRQSAQAPAARPRRKREPKPEPAPESEPDESE